MGMALELDRVVKRFTRPTGGSTTVLDGIDARCDAGGTLLVRGPSGSGKSTLLNLIAGLYRPDEGQVRVGDLRLDALTERQRDAFRAEHVGYVFQTFNLLSPLTALENLTVVAALAGQHEATTARRARAILDTLGLRDHQDKHPYELSVGQRQRVAVARALLQRPELLLADEPTANLDADASAAVIDAILELHREGTTVVVATHDAAVRDAFDSEVLDLDGGAAAP